MRFGTGKMVAALCAAASLAAGLPGAAPAAAADMPSFYAPAVTSAPVPPPLEFGSGWYLRGDASFGSEDAPRLLFRDDALALDRDRTRFGYAFGAGAGYAFNDWLRADVTADYLDPFHYAVSIPCGASCTIGQRTDLQRFDGLVNGYVDLGTYAGLTPYVGAGVGVGGAHQDGSIGVTGASGTAGTVDPRTGAQVRSSVPDRTDIRFAWAAMAGVSYAVAPHLLFDVGYRYLDLGRTTISLSPASVVTRGLSEQQVRVGLRYMVD